MSTAMLAKSLVALLAFTGNTDAFWRMSCSVVQTGRIDPIVSPGQVASHAHKISGASNIGLSSTFDELQTANCTSCEIQADKSAYWTPLLYYEHSNGPFEEVVAPGMAVYYLGRGDTTSDIKPFPPGFRMLSGDALARSYNKSAMTYKDTRPIADRVSFACLDTAPKPETPGMSDTSCKNGLRAQIHFQSCWNGKDLYKPDNSHVAYMSGIDNGECPPEYPVHFMHIFFEVLYSVANIKQDGGRFVFSDGDPTGFGFHGDFLNGWSPSVLTSAIAGCGINNGNPSGVVKSCPAFTSDIEDYAQVCPAQPPIVKEPVTGTIAKLPGCITITDGPEEATQADIVCGAGKPQPDAGLNNTANSTSSKGIVKRNRQILSRFLTYAANITHTSTNSTSVAKAASSSGIPLRSSSPSSNSSIIKTSSTSKNTTNIASSLVSSSSPSSTTVSTAKGPTVLPVSDGYVASGCYADAPLADIGIGSIINPVIDLSTHLLNSSYFTDLTSLTVEACMAFCAKGGFPAAGVEAGVDCFCGLSLNIDAITGVGKQLGLGDCDVPCKGSITEVCGGIGAMELYMSG